MNRRTFLSLGAGVVAGALATSVAQANPGSSIPVIDAHIHLFDPTRPQGVPWPEKSDKVLYRPALPDRYRRLASGFGVVGAIEIECSPWLEDNQWVLDVAAKNPIIVGTIGDLEPGKPGFRANLERFHRNPLFLGIRCGNLWGRDMARDMSGADFIRDIRELADAGLALETANQDPMLISALVRLTDKVPNLRAVVDHLPHLDPPADPAVRRQLQADLRELAARPQVYVKLSEILHPVNGQVHYDLEFYRSRLDEIWETFGQDRIMFGSDWPNCDPVGSYQQVFSIAHEYVSAKGHAVAEKFYWKNSIHAYRWQKRAPGQPTITD